MLASVERKAADYHYFHPQKATSQHHAKLKRPPKIRDSSFRKRILSIKGNASTAFAFNSPIFWGVYIFEKWHMLYLNR